MQLKYGTYSFNANDASLGTSREVMRSESGTIIGYVEKWTISFRLRADTQSELTTEINSLYDAFNVNGKDLVLLDNSSNNSSFVIDSSSSTSGTMIKSVSFPNLRDAQYTTYIDGTIQAEAEFITSTAADYSYTDSFTVRGNGGPKRVVIEVAVGNPIIQTTRQRTMVTATQSGSARGVGFAPPAATIMFPGYLVNESVSVAEIVSYESGKPVYVRNWNYEYQHSTFFAGSPILR